MDPRDELLKEITRRHFLGRSGAGVIGTVGLAMLLRGRSEGSDLFGEFGSGLNRTNLNHPEPIRTQSGTQSRTDPFAPKPPHYKPRAKSVIFLNMTGAPSQPDLFEFKDALAKYDGERVPKSAVEGLRLGPFTSEKLETMTVFIVA